MSGNDNFAKFVVIESTASNRPDELEIDDPWIHLNSFVKPGEAQVMNSCYLLMLEVQDASRACAAYAYSCCLTGTWQFLPKPSTSPQMFNFNQFSLCYTLTLFPFTTSPLPFFSFTYHLLSLSSALLHLNTSAQVTTSDITLHKRFKHQRYVLASLYQHGVALLEAGV
jgi:hypothetical protein